MQNRDLVTLRAIARAQSFRLAADRLNMTPSAVSMQMKALETALQAELFDRSVRPPRLTALGRAVADAAERVLEAEESLRRIAAPGASLSGRFRIGLVASAGPRLLPGFLSICPTRFPHSSFEFETGLSETLEREVADQRLDAAVVTSTGTPQGGLRHRVLFHDALCLATPDAAPRDAPFLQFAPSTGIGRLISECLGDRPQMANRRRIVLDHIETIRACVAAGVGPTILPKRDMQDLMGVEITDLGVGRDLVLVTRQGTPIDVAADELARAFQT